MTLGQTRFAVSYTHLDVYKRQGWFYAKRAYLVYVRNSTKYVVPCGACDRRARGDFSSSLTTLRTVK